MNKQLLLNKRPIGLPNEDTWKLITTEIPSPKPGEVLIKQQFISLDPAMRGWMDDRKSYMPPIGINEVMRAGSIGVVTEVNKNNTFQPGDYVVGWGGVQEYCCTNGNNWFKIDNSKIPASAYLSVLGMTGMTAYFGILNVGKIREGETVMVSAAAGAVGSLVGQIAKLKGCRVVGIAGGQQKCNYIVNTLGFHAAIDYKQSDFNSQLFEVCPNGIDVYFDNVGGDVLDAVLTNINLGARIVICGAISQYNSRTTIQGPKNYLSLLVNRASMSGMLVMDYKEQYPIAITEMAAWLQQGKLKYQEDIYFGIENFFTTFLKLFSGEKKGKLLLQLFK